MCATAIMDTERAKRSPLEIALAWSAAAAPAVLTLMLTLVPPLLDAFTAEPDAFFLAALLFGACAPSPRLASLVVAPILGAIISAVLHRTPSGIRSLKYDILGLFL
jgi:hypothetical protein